MKSLARRCTQSINSQSIALEAARLPAAESQAGHDTRLRTRRFFSSITIPILGHPNSPLPRTRAHIQVRQYHKAQTRAHTFTPANCAGAGVRPYGNAQTRAHTFTPRELRGGQGCAPTVDWQRHEFANTDRFTLERRPPQANGVPQRSGSRSALLVPMIRTDEETRYDSACF